MGPHFWRYKQFRVPAYAAVYTVNSLLPLRSVCWRVIVALAEARRGEGVGSSPCVRVSSWPSREWRNGPVSSARLCISAVREASGPYMWKLNAHEWIISSAVYINTHTPIYLYICAHMYIILRFDTSDSFAYALMHAYSLSNVNIRSIFISSEEGYPFTTTDVLLNVYIYISMM